jgi:hypothetical protein
MNNLNNNHLTFILLFLVVLSISIHCYNFIKQYRIKQLISTKFKIPSKFYDSPNLPFMFLDGSGNLLSSTDLKTGNNGIGNLSVDGNLNVTGNLIAANNFVNNKVFLTRAVFGEPQNSSINATWVRVDNLFRLKWSRGVANLEYAFPTIVPITTSSTTRRVIRASWSTYLIAQSGSAFWSRDTAPTTTNLLNYTLSTTGWATIGDTIFITVWADRNQSASVKNVYNIIMQLNNTFTVNTANNANTTVSIFIEKIYPPNEALVIS